MHMNVYCSSFSGSGTIKRIGMPSGPSENIGKMITNFIYRPIILLLQVVRNTLQLRRRRDKQFQVYTISLVIHFKRRAREQRNLEGSRVPPVGELYDISEWRACFLASYPGTLNRLKKGVETQDIIILQLWNHLLSLVAGDDKKKKKESKVVKRNGQCFSVLNLRTVRSSFYR